MKKFLAVWLALALAFVPVAEVQAQFFTPIIVFATGTPGPSYATWSSCCSGSNISITGSGRVASANTVSAWGTAQTAKNFTIKTYYEVTVTNVGGGSYIGIEVFASPSNFPFNNIGATYGFAWLNTGYVYDNSGVIATPPGYTTGDVLSFAVDPANRSWWVAKNCTYYNSGNPATGTNPTNNTINSSFKFNFAPTVSIFGGAGPTGSFTANFGSSAFTCSVPSGFQAGFY